MQVKREEMAGKKLKTNCVQKERKQKLNFKSKPTQIS